MKRISNILVLSIFLTLSILWLNCGDDNPLDLSDPSSLAGSYNLVSVADKTGELGPAGTSYNAGQATEVIIQGITATITLNGTLVLTETRFTFMFTAVTAATGIPAQTITDTSSGTYTISGSMITTVDDEDGATDTSSISTSGNRLTLDDSDVTLVFEKQ